jgi:hypothetical protein
VSPLLPLSALHTAAPGVLDQVFGPDGDFEGAPPFTGPVVLFVGRGKERWAHVTQGSNPHAMYVVESGSEFISEMALDLRVHSVYARLLRLCSFVETVDVDLSPPDLAALTLALAPRIAALP